MQFTTLAKLLAEFLGTAMIVAAVIGAGFMTATLDSGYPLGLTMIAATVAAVLFVSISILGPIWRSLQPCGHHRVLGSQRHRAILCRGLHSVSAGWSVLRRSDCKPHVWLRVD